MRRGLETLGITNVRWKESGLPDFAAPIHAELPPTTTVTTASYLVEMGREQPWTKAFFG